MRIEVMIQRMLDLHELLGNEHGKTDGVRTCGQGSALESLGKNGHACSRCVAREKLEQIEDILRN